MIKMMCLSVLCTAIYAMEPNIEARVLEIVHRTAQGIDSSFVAHDKKAMAFSSGLREIEPMLADKEGLALVVKRIQIVVGNEKTEERELLFAAYVLGCITEDAQSIELVIDAAVDARRSDLLHVKLKEMLVAEKVLTKAQRERLKGIANPE